MRVTFLSGKLALLRSSEITSKSDVLSMLDFLEAGGMVEEMLDLDEVVCRIRSMDHSQNDFDVV